MSFWIVLWNRCSRVCICVRNIRSMENVIQLADGFDLVTPRLGNLVEPLHAVYSKACLAPIENLLKQDNLKVSELLALVKVRYVEAKEINQFDPEHLSFFNINTKADLKTARELAGEGDFTIAKR